MIFFDLRNFCKYFLFSYSFCIFIGDLDEEGDRVLVAKGGAGGHITNGYLQQKGHALNVHLDLKVIADIGLVA